MEAINTALKQRPVSKDWQVTIQRRGYSTVTFYKIKYGDAIQAMHKNLAQDCEEFDGKQEDEAIDKK